VLKWILAYSVARHVVLTGQHPFQLWNLLPGPRGWLSATFFLLALWAFPIWVFFHASTLGTLVASVTGSAWAFNQGAHFVWGAAILAIVLGICLAGGYRVLEKIQLMVVLLMLASVIAVLFVIPVEWGGLFAGFVPQRFGYPTWINKYPEIAGRSPWLEAITCFGVIGGSSFDYLAYVSYLRDKKWGLAGQRNLIGAQLPPRGFDRRWLRAPLIDCTLSFAVVLIFTFVFLACGQVLLAPEHKVPSGSNLLMLQAAFVTPLAPFLKDLYFAGAFLAIFGTLYGTIEVAPAVLREFAIALWPEQEQISPERLRKMAIAWVTAGAFLLLVIMFAYTAGLKRSPPDLIPILTPANLFTGVLGCGIVCAAGGWTGRKTLQPGWGMPVGLVIGNLFAAGVFLTLGVLGYLQQGGFKYLLILLGTCATGLIATLFLRGSGTEHND
jgi:hypothetical protein